MSHSVRKLLLDIKIAGQEIEKFTSGKKYEDFLKDRILQLAIEREFEILEKH